VSDSAGGNENWPNGVPQNLRVEHPDCGHDFPDGMRQIAYRLFDENLK